MNKRNLAAWTFNGRCNSCGDKKDKNEIVSGECIECIELFDDNTNFFEDGMLI